MDDNLFEGPESGPTPAEILNAEKPRLFNVEDLAGRTVDKIEQVDRGVLRLVFSDSWSEVRVIDVGAYLGWDDTYRPDEDGDLADYDVFGEICGKVISRAEFVKYVGTAGTLKYFKIDFADGGTAWITPNPIPQSDMTLES